MLAPRLNLSYRTLGQGRWQQGEGEQNWVSLIIAICKDLMGEWLSTSFLRGKFLILIINKSFSRYAYLLSIKVYFSQFVYYNFWYLFPGGSDSEPVVMKLRGIVYTWTLWLIYLNLVVLPQNCLLLHLRRSSEC